MPRNEAGLQEGLPNGLCLCGSTALTQKQLDNPEPGVAILLNTPRPPRGGVNCSDLILASPPCTPVPTPPPLPKAPGFPRKLPPATVVPSGFTIVESD
jgi:hypothetical protein